MWSQSLKFNCLHRYLFFIFSVHDYSQNLVLQKTRMQTVALKVNFPLFLFGGIYSFSLFSEFWPLSALQHKCTSPWIPWLQCVDLSDSCSGPLRHLCKTHELWCCHEVWTVSWVYEQRLLTICPALSSRTALIFCSEKQPQTGRKMCGGCLLYHIILHNWCFFF